jgi:hypothetical protein
MRLNVEFPVQPDVESPHAVGRRISMQPKIEFSVQPKVEFSRAV